VRIFFRDTTQWSQLIILGVLVVVYVYNIRVLPLQSGEMITRYLVTLVVFLNLALSGFVLAAIAARFTFPALSLEGQTLWLLGSTPLDAGTILGAKYWVGAVPLTALAVMLTVATNAFLGVRPGLAILSLASVIGLSMTFTSQALAWGVYYPEFESENAAQIPTSVGGLLFMLGALVSLGLVVVAQIWVLRGYLMSGLPGRVPRDPFAWEIGLALFLTLAICGVSGVLPYRGAVRRLGRIGAG
jgi:ABC-2 type transport system permease protein